MLRSLLLALPLSAALAGTAHADTFTVTSTASVGPGTLYQALTNAAASPGPHSVVFNLPADSRIEMAHALPPIVSNELSIDGSAVPGLVVDGGGVVRLLVVGSPNSVFRLTNIELRGGRGERVGGCLLVQSPSNFTGASVTLDRVVMRDCQVRRSASNERVAGGAVYVDRRDVTVLDSRFIGNHAFTDDASLATIANGGAIAVDLLQDQLARIEGSLFVDNRVTGASDNGVGCCRASGAAVDALGTGVLLVSQSRFINNHADTLDLSTGWGDVLKSTMSTNLSRNLFFGNDNKSSMILVTITQPSGSFARVENNTLAANSGHVGAAVALTGVRESIVRNNTFLAWYGADFPQPHLRVLPYTGEPSSLVLSHNLFGPADSRWPDPNRPICQINDEVVVSNHHNQVYGTATNCGATLDPDMVDLRIEALRDHGGSVETVSFFQGSPVLDAGNPLAPQSADASRCQTIDARSFARPRDGDGNGVATCDIGAWESQQEAALFRHDFEQVLWRPAQ